MLEKREPPRNMLLRSLPVADLRAICSYLHRVDLLPTERLSDQGKPPQGVWFPESGFISVLVRDGRDTETEVAMIGREGAAGAVMSSAIRAAGFQFMAQQRGVAHCLAVDDLPTVLRAVPALRNTLAAAVSSLLAQVASTAHANVRGRVVERLARWLLMAHDRVDADVLFLTHDILAAMLGVRRVGVTNALHILEGEKLIRAYRGRIRILDRHGLIAMTNGLYASPRRPADDVWSLDPEMEAAAPRMPARRDAEAPASQAVGSLGGLREPSAPREANRAYDLGLADQRPDQPSRGSRARAAS